MIIEKHIFIVNNLGQTAQFVLEIYSTNIYRLVFGQIPCYATELQKKDKKQSSSCLFPSDRKTKIIWLMLFYNDFISLETNEWIIFIPISFHSPPK